MNDLVEVNRPPPEAVPFKRRVLERAARVLENDVFWHFVAGPLNGVVCGGSISALVWFLQALTSSHWGHFGIGARWIGAIAGAIVCGITWEVMLS